MRDYIIAAIIGIALGIIPWKRILRWVEYMLYEYPVVKRLKKEEAERERIKRLSAVKVESTQPYR